MTQWETQTQKTPKERNKTLWFIRLWRYRRTNLKPQNECKEIMESWIISRLDERIIDSFNVFNNEYENFR